MLKNIGDKDEKQIDQEKREKGFSIYVNGAHTHRSKTLKNVHSQRKQWTKPHPQTARGIFIYLKLLPFLN